MGCESLTFDTEQGSFQGIICSRGRKPKHGSFCASCGRPAGFLCDKRVGAGGTCDAPICEQHTTLIGHNRHHCPEHAVVQQLTLGPEIGAAG